MQHNTVRILQIAFTYIGTIVGAGFATGQEILQFFTKYGSFAVITIWISTFLFIWLGTKILLLAHDIKAHSYADLNRLLFGPRAGAWVSGVMLILLFCITSVMLAGAGSVFKEQFHLPYQLGLWITMIAAYFTIMRGIDAILAVNTVVVPTILVFTVILVINTMQSPNAALWMVLESEPANWRLWLSPFLYTGFNLLLAQAVLVPIGAKITDRTVVYWGGVWGGIGIGAMLMAGHFTLSSRMPVIMQYEIPMGILIVPLGLVVQILFLITIYAEIFTTYIANIYGLSLQIEQRIPTSFKSILIVLLILTFAVSQIGFSKLLTTLYPLFGFLSLGWLAILIFKKSAKHN